MKLWVIQLIAIVTWTFTVFVIIACDKPPLNHGLIYQARCYIEGKMVYENTNAYSYQRKGSVWIIFTSPEDFVEVHGNCIIKKIDLFK